MEIVAWSLISLGSVIATITLMIELLGRRLPPNLSVCTFTDPSSADDASFTTRTVAQGDLHT